MNRYRLLSAFLVLTLAALACSSIPNLPGQPTRTPAFTATPLPTSTPAPVSAILEGPYQIRGAFTYTNNIITIGTLEQAVALVDMYGFITRDLEWEIPVESQTLGYLDLDEQAMTGEFWLQLPARPNGYYADVDNDGAAEAGVQVFAVAYWPNYLGGPFSQGDDRSRGWPSFISSAPTNTENNDEVTGGKLVVWSPDNEQEFPTGFGGDGLLFTDDDPVGPIPAGYSVVDLDQTPFDISQETEPQVELYEPQDIAVKDYSALSYTEAFEALFEKVSTEWAFNGVPGKEVDWQALHDKVAPLVADAEQKNDAFAYYRALQTFTLGIPDGHTGLSGGEMASQDFTESTGGGYGFAIRELDDGKVIVVYVLPGGPADEASMKVGAEVTEFNEKPIGQAIGDVVARFVGPFSTESYERYQQARYLLREKVGVEATVTFINLGAEPQTATLTSVAERNSFAFTSIARGSDPNALPVEYRILESGLGYIKVNSNYDDIGLIYRIFERALIIFTNNGVPGVIIDMRQNSGGFPLGLAGFFSDQEILFGQSEYYSEKTGQFEPDGLPDIIFPNERVYTFDKLAVIVGQACASACEFESYGFSKLPGTIVVGMYPSGGIFAEVARGQFVLPEGMSVQVPTGRTVDADGDIVLEGVGVVPTVKVPITEETVLTNEDVELKAAQDAIFGVSPDDVQIEGGPTLGSPASTKTALIANTPLLEQQAQEQYSADDLAEVGATFTYTVALEQDTRLMWGYGWCATSRAILNQNYEHLKMEFAINGQPIALDKFYEDESATSGLFCKSYYVVVFRWPSGETKLQTVVTFEEKINDGVGDYEAGTQTFDYTVTLP